MSQACTSTPFRESVDPPGLFGWMTNPSSEAGFRFADGRSDWRLTTYSELAERAWGLASELGDVVGRGDVVALVLPTGVEFPSSIWATLLLGAVPTPLSPPRVGTGDEDLELIRRQVALAGSRVVLTTSSLVSVMQTCLGDSVRIVDISSLTRTARVEALPDAPEQVLLQFTSGSTSVPKPIAISKTNLETNLAAIVRWLGVDASSSGATWLPMSHDMGLIGCMFMPTVIGSDVWAMAPAQYIRSPARWLRCFGIHGVRITAAPLFGYAYALRRLRTAASTALAGCDFSGWDVAIVGAERLSAAVLRAFSDMLKPFGFQATTFRPAYGMAEATVAVTGTRRGDQPNVYALGDKGVELVGPLGAVQQPLAGSGLLVGSGRPIDGVSVTVTGPPGDQDDGAVGEIMLSGPSISDSVPTIDLPDLPNMWPTRDVGALVEGELVVLGRSGDAVKVRGRTVLLEGMEDILESRGLLGGANAALVTGVRNGGQHVALVTERRLSDEDTVRELLALTFADSDTTVSVMNVRRGSVLRTASGKPRRKEIWQQLVGSS